jgi:hypothetical protein
LGFQTVGSLILNPWWKAPILSAINMRKKTFDDFLSKKRFFGDFLILLHLLRG